MLYLPLPPSRTQELTRDVRKLGWKDSVKQRMDYYPAYVVLLPPILLFGTLIPVLYVPVEIKNDDRFSCLVKHSKTLLFVNDVTLFRHGLVQHEHACN